jgi:hypothetical protein
MEFDMESHECLKVSKSEIGLFGIGMVTSLSEVFGAEFDFILVVEFV